MRSDTNLKRRFVEEGIDASQYGGMPPVLDTSKKVDGKPVLRSHSFSGNESNSVFLNHGGADFENISGVSGLDSLADGRAFAFFDFDHDAFYQETQPIKKSRCPADCCFVLCSR